MQAWKLFLRGNVRQSATPATADIEEDEDTVPAPKVCPFPNPQLPIPTHSLT